MSAYRGNNVFFSCLMLLLITGSSYALTGKEINAICGQALNGPFCLNFVKSNPKILAAGLPEAARITIDSAQATASNTLKKIRSLVQTATDPKSKQAYTSCLDSYKDAVSNLGEAKQHLAEGDPASVNIKVSAAMDGPQDCVDALKNIKADPSVLKNSEVIGNVCGVTLVISNMLPRRA